MPSPSVRALLATARITGVAGLVVTGVACKKAAAPDAATASTAPTEAPARDASPADPGDAFLAAIQDDDWTDEEVATCAEIVKDELGDVDYGEMAKGRVTASPTAARCCAASRAVWNSARWGCCAVSEQTGVDDDEVFARCTPWGPPAPPAMA